MKILIADEMHPSIVSTLASQGWEYEYLPSTTRKEILESLHAYDGLVIRSKTFVDRELLDYGPKLRFVARAGAGLDQIDVKEVNARKIALFHASEGNADTVAEHLLGMLLGLLSKIVVADAQVRKGIWEREGNRGVELMGKTVGLIGYGHNGHATAKRLSSFGCHVLAYDKYQTGFSDSFASESSLEEIKEKADILSLHIPLTTETKGMINESFLQAMKKPFYMLNIARGEIVVLEDLIKGLKNGKILGACLDVLENEKLETLTPRQKENFDFLIKSDRVVLTPHIGGWSKESYVRINEVLSAQIKNWLEENQINPRA